MPKLKTTSIIFLFTALITFLIFIIQFNSNSNHANSLKNQILSLDQEGENTSSLIDELKTFSTTHMNASITVELIDSYNRALQASEQSQQASGETYAKAQAACASRADSITQARCVNNYLAQNAPVNANSQAIAAPDRNQYIFTYKSPLLTPDLAGVMLLISLTSLGVGFWLWGLRR